jgi:hypothetical protein
MVNSTSGLYIQYTTDLILTFGSRPRGYSFTGYLFRLFDKLSLLNFTDGIVSVVSHFVPVDFLT